MDNIDGVVLTNIKSISVNSSNLSIIDYQEEDHDEHYVVISEK